MHARRWVAATAALVVGLVVAGCAAEMKPTARTSARPATAPTPTVPTRLPVSADDLPRLVIDRASVTQWCELWENDDPDVDSLLTCGDTLEYAIRATGPLQGTIGSASFAHARSCATCPQLRHAARVTLLSRAAGTLLLDVERAADGALLVWPVVPGSPPPPAPPIDSRPVERPSLPGAPPELRDRQPYPFCGRIDLLEVDPALRCFVDSVAAGQPAELIRDGFTTEGDPFTEIYRFGGTGAVVKWVDSSQDGFSSGGWTHRTGALYRIDPDMGFSCD